MSGIAVSRFFSRTRVRRALLVGALLGWLLLLLAEEHVLSALDALMIMVVAGGLLTARRETAATGVARGGDGSHSMRDTGGADEEPSGVASRQALEAKLTQESALEGRAHVPTGLVLIHLDGLEAIAERCGEMAGNVALLTVAGAMKRALPRRDDLLARYDTYTFAAVLPGTDLPGALRVAARLRWAILRLGIANAGSETGLLSASLGVAVQHGVSRSAALLAAAEAALRAARARGFDSLEYLVVGGEDRGGQRASEATALPAGPAWPATGEPGHGPVFPGPPR